MRKDLETYSRIFLLSVVVFCIFAVVVSCIGRTPHVTEESLRVDETSVTDVTTTEETTTTTELVTTTTTETTTTETTTTETTTTIESSTSETTVTTMTTSSETTTTTKHLMTYDILTRIDMISMLLDESDYKRLIEKDPADLTAEERTELQYYACLVFERKQLREYLSENKSD